MSWVPVTPVSGLQGFESWDNVLQWSLNLHMAAYSEQYQGGELVYLAVPASTAFAAGTLVTSVPTTITATLPSGATQTITSAPTIQVLPANGTTVRTGQPVYVAIIASTTSDVGYTGVRYGWFLRQGIYPVLKTAVAVNPSTTRAFVSGTAGRFFVTSTSGCQILGMRPVNLATVASGTSTVLCQLDRPLVSGVNGA